MTSRGARAGKPQVGQRCALTEHNGEQATIRFVGTTKFATGIWVSLLQEKRRVGVKKRMTFFYVIFSNV
jgi:poly-beta-hydroxyalkanoate depolymerase